MMNTSGKGAEQMFKPIIGVTLGDAAGIGPEIVAKTAAKGILTESAQPIIIADERLLQMGIKIAGVHFDYTRVEAIEEAAGLTGLVLLDTHSADIDHLVLGEVSSANGKEEGDLLIQCIDYCKRGLLSGFCYAPLNKGAMKKGEHDFPSEHEMFARYYGIARHYSEMNVLGNLWNIRVTSHIPLNKVCENITVPAIMNVAELGYATLCRAGIKNPRFAMAALNPHAGDNGTCGTEEITVLAEAIKEISAKGIQIQGPFAADTLFIRAFNGDFDGVITMFHDQGQIAIKLRGFEHAVTVAAGFPNAITTPAHGTAYDIAGKGIAKTSTFEDAYRLCVQMALTDSTPPDTK
jgi:4-hydroxythreonine-4-phosphate dehydrogenase